MSDAVDLVVGPRLRPLEGLTVNRVWPTARRRLIGPFIFLDHMQPVALAAGRGLDVPPHPHIGLATVTYLFEGALQHADSLGVEQRIEPGALNWMTAGRGITHSERTPADERARTSRLHGVQAWVALPRARERDAPSFEHVAAADLPLIEQPGAKIRLIAGSAFGAKAPVATASPLFYAEAELEPEAAIALDRTLGERAVYIVSGSVGVGGVGCDAGRLFVLKNGIDCEVVAHEPTRLMLLGGPPLDGERHIWWNFVASDPALIETAKRDWAERRFAPVPNDDGYMPLPSA
ncbi:MAG: pirin family protein [Gammaproteobacteria bacterium]|nr:pirin family protein [Gammaproteobacteria bacterium]